jgi:hypothetical protein
VSTSTDDYVWHFAKHRPGARPERGERLATLAMTSADVAAAAPPAPYASSAARLSAGAAAVRAAVDAERRDWVRRLLAAGFDDGWSVSVIAERGYRRSLFPGVGLGALAGASPALVVIPGGQIQ